MRLIAPVFVEKLFDGRAGLACSKALAQCRQPGKPRPAVCGRSRLGQPGEFGDRMSVAGDHDFLAALGQVISLSNWDCVWSSVAIMRSFNPCLSGCHT